MRPFALALFAVRLSAQTPQFDVASIRPSEPVLNQVNVGYSVDRNSVRITTLPLGYYIRIAYNVKASQLIGPDHLQDRFDITARIPDGVSQDKVPEMLQGLLADRFQLKFHRESRDMQVYVLTRGKGPLGVREVPETPVDANAAVTAGGTGTGQGMSVNLGNGSSYSFNGTRWDGRKLTFEDVVDQLEQFVDRPIVDQTNLKGHYDLVQDVTQEDGQTMRARASVNAGFPLPPQVMQRLDTAQFPSFFEAFEKLGLKLESKKVAQQVIVVDSILKVPTEN